MAGRPQKFHEGMTYKQWAEKIGLTVPAVAYRIREGLPLDRPKGANLGRNRERKPTGRKQRVYTRRTPDPEKGPPGIQWNEEWHSIRRWSIILKINYYTLYRRLVLNKWSVEEAFTRPVDARRSRK